MIILLILQLNVELIKKYNYRENVRELNISRLSSMSKTISNPDDQSNETVIDEGTKLLVGSVEQVMHWIKMLTILERTKILYQVFGTFIHSLIVI